MIPIIIVNWNGWNDTLECIESTLKTIGVDFHIHLIDNGSDNEEGLKLARKYNNTTSVTVHLFNKNYGFTGAHLKIWNEILIHQDHTFIALLNNDTTVDHMWLSNLYQMALIKQCSIVSAKMIQYHDRSKMDNAGHMMLNTGEILPIGYGEPIEAYSESFKNLGGCGGAVLYSTKMIKDIGFFDDFFATGYEDAELGLRATVLGYVSWYCPKSQVYHKGGQSIIKVNNRTRDRKLFLNILYTFFKNLNIQDIIINIFFVIIKNIIAIFVLLLSFNFTVAIEVARSFFSIIIIRKRIIKYRKELNRPTKKINSEFHFFLKYDISRIYRISFLTKH